MDIVFINNLIVETIIGVYPHEKTVKQPLVFDLELEIDANIAAKSDNLKDTIDYEAFSNWLVLMTNQKKFNLLEALAEYLCQNIIQEFNIPRVKLKITKPNAIKATKTLGVIIERRSSDYNLIDRPQSTASI